MKVIPPLSDAQFAKEHPNYVGVNKSKSDFKREAYMKEVARKKKEGINH